MRCTVCEATYTSRAEPVQYVFYTYCVAVAVVVAEGGVTVLAVAKDDETTPV
jgi:hypothetical protein